MKKVTLSIAAAALAVSATTSFAGGYSEPVIEAPVVVEEAAGSSAGSLGGSTALLLLGALGLAVALNSN